MVLSGGQGEIGDELVEQLGLRDGAANQEALSSNLAAAMSSEGRRGKALSLLHVPTLLGDDTNNDSEAL